MRFFNRQTQPEPAQVAEAPATVEPSKAERRTPPMTSPAFTVSQHVPCIPNWRDFMEGKLPLPDACREGHAYPPTPQERGLIS